MENQVIDSALQTERLTAYTGPDTAQRGDAPAAGELRALRIPVGTNLADAERWMIFATLQKCSGNKTRAAALLGVSLKTLYNRLNAYRAQGLAMDYDQVGEGGALESLEDVHARADDLHG